jgi:nitrate reductase assembly molybdenum cofactor insertion protein NarJ
MSQTALRRAQIYFYLSHAFLYPQENWLEDLPVVRDIFAELEAEFKHDLPDGAGRYDLAALQADYHRVFGLTGSLLYETEFGLPHEFRQSQELADIAGFYQAFGFKMGGAVRERPDHLAAELEFMYLLSLKEAYALSNQMPEMAEICREAQSNFLRDHLARWISPFCAALEQSMKQRNIAASPGEPYLETARLAASFVEADALRLGVVPEPRQTAGLKPTPFDPDPSCGACLAREISP